MRDLLSHPRASRWGRALLIVGAVMVLPGLALAGDFSYGSAEGAGFGLAGDYIHADGKHDGALMGSARVGGDAGFVAIFLTTDVGYRFDLQSPVWNTSVEGYVLLVGAQLGLVQRFRPYRIAFAPAAVVRLPVDRFAAFSLLVGGNIYLKDRGHTPDELFLRLRVMLGP